ncbi:MAG: peptidoglycan binding protein CsiV [Gammaproteobacteria bacterium]|nr:peptidoglycan binding protein CsiV [Gammaproteobacteria bacterium]
MKKISLLIISLLLGAVASAQQAVSDDSDESVEHEEIRHYTVEIIIFSYVQDVSVGSEIFVPETIEPLDEPFEEMEPPIEVSDEAMDSEPRRVYPFDYAVLSRDELTMRDAWSHLRRLDAYRPLMHFGWTQPAIPQDQTIALELQRFGNVPARLDGTLQLFLSRFLHLVVDVSLSAPDAERAMADDVVAARQPIATFGDERTQNSYDYDPFAPQYAPLRYRIVEDRIMKNGETRYYDHPKLGVIAKVTRVEEEPKEDGDELVLP